MLAQPADLRGQARSRGAQPALVRADDKHTDAARGVCVQLRGIAQKQAHRHTGRAAGLDDFLNGGVDLGMIELIDAVRHRQVGTPDEQAIHSRHGCDRIDIVDGGAVFDLAQDTRTQVSLADMFDHAQSAVLARAR